MTRFQLHAKKWKGCTACSLCKTRHNVVLARGQIPCDLLLIGEAPGISEDRLGTPFIGPAGKMLDQLIAAATVEYNPVRIAFTNLVCCIPMNEEEDKKVSVPPKEAIKACAPRLQEFVDICKPNGIVCVGQEAHKNIPASLTEGRRYEQIIHPAAILRANMTIQPIQIQNAVATLKDIIEDLTIPF